MSVHAEPPPAIVSEPHGISYATANQLGKGGFAICFKAERLDKDRPTGHLVALKIVRTKMEPAKLAQKFVTELQIHSKLSHPNIVAFHRAFSFGESTYVVLELCSNGSLADLLKRRKNITMPEIRRFIIQVSGAVKYLHARNIVHRDLKTGNLFLDEHMNIKVGDFGLAALLVSGKDMEAKRRTTMCGTPNYLAPEILEKGKGHNEKVDLWAIGIIAYTLAVGKAPFHATSKDEIYKKLRAGDYSWPELSSITNDISADLRDLVSSLLVAEELRPCPDQIVSHTFFKIAFVPKHMSRSQITKAPTWPNASLPTPEVLQRGYSDSWWHVCKESGVGEYMPGKFFQLNSGKRIRSVVRDIEREVAAGRQPVLPIPHDTVYTTHPYSGSWAPHNPTGLEEISEEKESAGETRQLKEIANNEVQKPAVVVPRHGSMDSEARKRKEIELMPPPTYTRRQGPVRTIRSARVKPADDDQNRPISQERIPQTGSENLLKNSTSSSQPDGIEGTVPNKRSVDASLARRPRALRKNLSTREMALPEAEAMRAEDALPKGLQPTRSVRSRTRQPAPPETIEVYDEEPKPAKCPELPVSAPKRADIMTTNGTAPALASAVSGTNPDEVLKRLCVFRDNLAAAVDRKRSAPSRRAQQQIKSLPFVSRWVDYSRKHGVGYVLEDGTVGYIANAIPEKGTPVTHVTVRDGERWLKRTGKRFENLDKVPFQIMEDRGPAGIHKMPQTPTHENERERQRMLKVLWVKFGRYMVPGVNESEDLDIEMNDGEESDDMVFVRFYQRLGNVGVWGFSDGCVQMHFPDHTKFVFSADGLHVSSTLVPVEGIAAIETNNDLPLRLLRDRVTMQHSVHALLYGSQPGRGQKPFAEVVRANMVEQKIDFLGEVLEQWICGGGLGCSTSVEKQQWRGLWVSDHARKIDWVTVGRQGGDDIKR